MNNGYKVLLIFFLVLISSKVTFAQTGTISGSVIDKNSASPIEAVSVSIINSKDSSIAGGAETDPQGKFTISNLNFGTYFLRADIVGYNKVVLRGITINKDAPVKNLDPIQLTSGGTETEEIVVEGERSAIEFKADKKVFNVEQGMNVQGGSAVDVLKNIPSVSVDADGNISLRGDQNVKILVDGKPFGMNNNPESKNSVLDQIPSNLIQSVELVTNPSAKYQAENSAGIINIILKKNLGFGYNGSLTLNGGSRDKYNGSININFRKDKFNIYTSYDYRLYNFLIDGKNTRDNFGFNTFYDNTTTGTARNLSHFARLGFDYNINDNASLSYGINYNPRERKRNDNSDAYTTSSSTGSLISHYNLLTNENTKSNTLDMSLNFFRKFKNPMNTLTAEAIYTNYSDDVNTITQQNLISPTGPPVIRNTMADSKSNEANLTVDYTYPFSKDAKLESGIRLDLDKSESDYSVEDFDNSTGIYVVDPSTVNSFTYKQNVYAAYMTYTGAINKFNYQLGLRGEQYYTTGDLKTTGEVNDRSAFDLFPSALLTQKIGETQELQLSYSRRIDRPDADAVNPFKYSLDPFNYFQGNPNLRPEYTNSLELGFIKYFKTTTVNPSIFYKHTKDQIARTRTIVDTNLAAVSFENYGKAINYGAELVLNTKPWDFLSMNGSISYYKNDVDAKNLDSSFVNNNYTWSGRMSANLTLPDIADLGVSYFYSGKNAFAQGIVEPFQTFDISLKRDFLDRQLTLGLRFADIFNTLKFKVNLNNTVNFNESFERKRDNRAIYATVTWRFGTDQKIQDKKRRRNNGNDDGGFGF